MKKHISSLIFGTVGIGAGFALCYISLVLPQQEAAEKGREAQKAMVALSKVPQLHVGDKTLIWQPHVIQPTLPPKVVR